ncbi:MAG: D-glycero-beta-D-manno-heptose 1,7-bisphosphate 7-phosphatase [Proteobacteria bacterium]|nr:D-glycero-beta-D-manno-heptose 1,7-bisphosphate 7-phosphatase [Pseudomonadota bacterium]MBU1713814.1 D-glycero-beta-D-manno-heptose 1,7-bisphosphate 7-phosphatase [Pseudomonadota bacterium]
MNGKYIFLDRDGVINRDSPDYVKSWSEFEFIPGSLDAIKILAEYNYSVVVITNQSIINRKMASLDDLEFTHAMMKKAVRESGGEIKEIFFCPHKPEDGCKCRKPEPGLIFEAQKKYGIALKNTAMVGDSAKDIECARRAGCRFAVLVKTGNYQQAVSVLEEKKIYPDYIARDLYEAAGWIIANVDNCPDNCSL